MAKGWKGERGGTRPGSGRKPTGRKKAAMLVRVEPELRRRLERDAKQARRSLSSEVELQLTDALRTATAADRHTRALCYLIGQIAPFAAALLKRPGEDIETVEFDWRTNPIHFDIFRLLILRLLNEFAPAESRAPHDKLFEGVGADIQAVVRGIWAVLYSLLRAPEKEVYAGAAEMGEGKGSPLYAFPQAARDLNLRKGADQ